MAQNKRLAKKRAARAKRRAQWRGLAGRQSPRRTCVLCAQDCTDDGVMHDIDCGHGWVVCPVCAVRTCEDCVQNDAVIARAMRRDPSVEIRVDPLLVERLNEKLSGVSLADVAGPLKMFMRATVPCGSPCSGRMVYVEGSERWPSQADRASVPDALVSYDRRCTVCGRLAPSTIGDVAFDDFDDLDDGPQPSP